GGGRGGNSGQLGNGRAGSEADIQGTGQEARPRSFICPAGLCNPTAGSAVGLDHGHKLDWYGTLRGRFGAVVTPDALLYGTAGAAVAGLSQVRRLQPEGGGTDAAFVCGTQADLLA